MSQILLYDKGYTNKFKFFKYKNAAHIKFGWAMTVHKAMGSKWDEVFFNVDLGQNRGKSNKAYFKWLYSGIVTARERVNLINLSLIHI